MSTPVEQKNHAQSKTSTLKSTLHSWCTSPYVHTWWATLLVALPFMLWASDAWARKSKPIVSGIGGGLESNPMQLVLLLGGMALLPFLLMMVTSFVKIAVVLSIIRSALGTQQNPPTQVITGMAIILTVYVMVPVGMDIYNNIQPEIKSIKRGDAKSKDMMKLVPRLIQGGSAPVKQFLRKHSHVKEREMFYNLGIELQRSQENQRKQRFKKAGRRYQPPKLKKNITNNDFIVLIPSFVISELKEAFQIGFLIFLPFLIVDMVVANILLALGMHMLSPTTISLPFKLLLFVLVDGWYLLAKGLVLGYI